MQTVHRPSAEQIVGQGTSQGGSHMPGSPSWQATGHPGSHSTAHNPNVLHVPTRQSAFELQEHPSVGSGFDVLVAAPVELEALGRSGAVGGMSRTPLVVLSVGTSVVVLVVLVDS